ncbi:UNVERIFIED_CONTAM: hypothetical protein Sradi_3468500 [Sesamum radiatum]|uniref:DUF6821 domain-containing protein n=1 Tax=Sesamum radiatum TaxID=300843 RepID=A0AAW2QDB4_SESRA
MEVLEATNDFQDWDVVRSNSVSESASVDSFDEIDSGGLIQTNYFSLDAHNHYGQDLDDKKSSIPSWINPRLEENSTRYLNLESGEFWSDSSSQRSDDPKFSDEVAFSLNEKKKVGFQGIREIDEEKCATMVELGKSYLDSNGIEMGSAKLNDSVENPEVGVGGHVNLHDELEVLDKEKNENEKIGSGSEVIHENVEKRRREFENRGLAWWKMPMEFLRYCVFRVSPVWTVSVVAAALGFVILWRRLYKMKKRTKGLQIKITVDDKKVSQVISHTARLNEAFLVVKRVPVVRPSLPSVGIITWPVMSLR